MKLSLPEQYSYKDIASVKDGILYIYRHGCFQDIMYDLTYNVKDGSQCFYCGKPLTRNTSSLDHMYPRDLGGPTIPENLCISCPKCNSRKSNMTTEEYLFYLSLPKDKQKEYFDDVRFYKTFLYKWHVPFIPEEWISQEEISKVTVYFYINQNIEGKSYKRVEKTYKKYGKIGKPIIVDRNFKLLDGFNIVLFAKNNSICTLPTIILENVEML